MVKWNPRRYYSRTPNWGPDSQAGRLRNAARGFRERTVARVEYYSETRANERDNIKTPDEARTDVRCLLPPHIIRCVDARNGTPKTGDTLRFVVRGGAENCPFSTVRNNTIAVQQSRHYTLRYGKRSEPNGATFGGTAVVSSGRGDF